MYINKMHCLAICLREFNMSTSYFICIDKTRKKIPICTVYRHIHNNNINRNKFIYIFKYDNNIKFKWEDKVFLKDDVRQQHL